MVGVGVGGGGGGGGAKYVKESCCHTDGQLELIAVYLK